MNTPLNMIAENRPRPGYPPPFFPPPIWVVRPREISYGKGQEKPAETNTPWFASFYPAGDLNMIDSIEKWFKFIDLDKNGTLDETELGKALEQAGFKFAQTLISQLIRVFDFNNSGTVDIDEFVCIYIFLNRMRDAFTVADKDKSGTLELNELETVLGNSDFKLSQESVHALLLKFSQKKAGSLTLEEYTELCVHLGSLRSFFQTDSFIDTTGTGSRPSAKRGITTESQHWSAGTITLNYNQLVQATPHFSRSRCCCCLPPPPVCSTCPPCYPSPCCGGYCNRK